MPGSSKQDKPLKPGPAKDLEETTAPEDDTEGQSFILDPELARVMARDRERQIQRDLRNEARRPFLRRGK